MDEGKKVSSARDEQLGDDSSSAFEREMKVVLSRLLSARCFWIEIKARGLSIFLIFEKGLKGI